MLPCKMPFEILNLHKYGDIITIYTSNQSCIYIFNDRIKTLKNSIICQYNIYIYIYESRSRGETRCGTINNAFTRFQKLFLLSICLSIRLSGYKVNL